MSRRLPEKQKKARALKMLEAKILKNKTNAELAKEFGVSTKTVQKALTLARKAEIMVTFEDKLYSELLPLAHDAVTGALLDGNAKVGLAILQGTQVLRPNQARTRAQEADDDELARYINQKRAQAALDERTHDAQFRTIHPETGLPPAPTLLGEGTILQGPGSQEIEPPRAPEDSAPGPTDPETTPRAGRDGD